MLLTTISCGSGVDRSAGRSLQIAINRAGRGSPTYITSLDCAELADSSTVLGWTDQSDDGGHVWTARARLTPSGGLTLVQGPRLIDRGTVSDVNVFAYADSYAVLYTSDDQLFCQAPAGAPRRVLTASNDQAPVASAGYGLDASHYFVVSVLLQTHFGPPTTDLVLTTAGKDSVHSLVVGTLQERYVPLPPRPQFKQCADTLLVTVVMPYGQFTSPFAPGASSGDPGGGAGACVQLHLRTTEVGAPVIAGITQATMPPTAVIGKVSSFGLLDIHARALAVAQTRSYIVVSSPAGAPPAQLSSAEGNGDAYGRPIIAAVPTTDAHQLVAWIDAGSREGEVGLAAGTGVNPMVYGGSLHAVRVRTDSTRVEGAVPGFPIPTLALCVTAGTVHGRPILAWARCQSALGSARPKPDAICVQVVDPPG